MLFKDLEVGDIFIIEDTSGVGKIYMKIYGKESFVGDNIRCLPCVCILCDTNKKYRGNVCYLSERAVVKRLEDKELYILDK